MQRGNNTVIIAKNKDSLVAHADQIRLQEEYEEEEEDRKLSIQVMILQNNNETNKDMFVDDQQGQEDSKCWFQSLRMTEKLSCHNV